MNTSITRSNRVEDMFDEAYAGPCASHGTRGLRGKSSPLFKCQGSWRAKSTMGSLATRPSGAPPNGQPPNLSDPRAQGQVEPGWEHPEEDPDTPDPAGPPGHLERRSAAQRSLNRMDSRLIVVAVMASGTLLAGCGSSRGTTPTPSATSLTAGAIQVTTSPNCPGQRQQNSNEVDLFPLGVADSGRTYSLVRCQAVDALLLHPSEDGCRWTTVQSGDDAVVAILPIPLPLPPGGSTNEAYIAVAPGHATLSSSLVCPSGTLQRWAVTLIVLR